METTLCKYNGMSRCIANNREDQKAGCTFADKSRHRNCCMHYGVNDTCDCLEAQKIAYENYNGEKQ